jgi:hypothetical protein
VPRTRARICVCVCVCVCVTSEFIAAHWESFADQSQEHVPSGVICRDSFKLTREFHDEL